MLQVEKITTGREKVPTPIIESNRWCRVAKLISRTGEKQFEALTAKVNFACQVFARVNTDATLLIVVKSVNVRMLGNFVESGKHQMLRYESHVKTLPPSFRSGREARKLMRTSLAAIEEIAI